MLEKSVEVQSVVRGLCGQIKWLEGWGRRGGRGGSSAGGILRGQGRWHTFFSHQDLAEDDGEQEKKELFGRVRVLSRQLAPDQSWVKDPSAPLSVPAGGAGARGRGRRLRERIKSEDLRTGAPPGSRARGGYWGRSPQDGHGREGTARVTHGR